MKRLLLAALCLSACSPQQVQDTITISTAIMPCYLAVKAATSASDTQANIANGSATFATNPACANVTAAGVHVISTALAKNAPVVVAPVSAPEK